MTRLHRVAATAIVILAVAGFPARAAIGLSVEVKKILDEAQQAASTAQDDVWKAVSLYSIAETQTKIGDQAGAARTSQALRRVMESFHEGLERSFAEYFVEMARVQASVKLGVMQEAVNAAARIKDDYQRAEILRSIALQQVKAGDRASAAKTLVQAAEAALSVEGKSQLVIALQFVAGAQAEAGLMGAARQTLGKLDEYDKQGGLREIALGQARAGDITGALETIGTIKNPMWKSTAIRQVVGAQIRNGDLDAALRTIPVIEWDATRAAALRDVVEAQASTGRIVDALKNATGLTDKKEVARAKAAIALAETRGGDGAAATKTFQAALQAAASVESEIDRSAALAAVAEAQARSGDVASSAKTLARIPAEYRDGYARELARVHAERGAFKSAVEITETIQLEPTRAQAAASIATAQAKTGQVTDALGWASRQAPPIVKANALIGIAAGMLDRPDTERRAIDRSGATTPAPKAAAAPKTEIAPKAAAAPKAEVTPKTAAAPKAAPERFASVQRRDPGPAGPWGMLVVEVRPADAQVFLDGALLGSAAELVAHGLPVSAGKHVIRIIAPGFKRHSTEFITDPSFPVRIRVALTPE